MMGISQATHPLKVIVIQQPWAWLIVNAFKDIENRTWSTRYRGDLLIQASAAAIPKSQMEEFRVYARERGVKLTEEFETGGVVGMVEVVACVTRSGSRWFEGPVGWVLSNPKKLKFIPSKGRLGLFDPKLEVVEQLRRAKVKLD